MGLLKRIADMFRWQGRNDPAPVKKPDVEVQEGEDPIPRLCFPNGRSCPHGPATGVVTVLILGELCEFDSPPMCKECTEKYLNKYATTCIACKMPILPGDPVGDPSGALTPIGSKFAHLADGCCDTGGFYCGNWGEGRLVRLHEIDPKQFPEGTTTVMALAFTSGEPVVVNTY